MSTNHNPNTQIPPAQGGFQLNVQNMLSFVSTLAPVILSFFMIMISVFNQNVKGLVYLAGALLAVVINLMLMRLPIGSNTETQQRDYMCNVMDFPFTNGRSMPHMNSMFIAFTAAYLYFPMYSEGTVNMSLVISMAVLIAIEATISLKNKCANVGDIMMGCLVGALLGYGWFSVFDATGMKSLLFFNEVNSDGYYCNKPSEQRFVCEVYKNGELIAEHNQ